MLQVHFIRENKDAVLAGLAKRNFGNATTIIEQVLTADENRRATQVLLDNTLAESNKLSKEIGNLYKTGQAQKANILKEKTVQLKQTSKELAEKSTALADELQTLLYQIPNVPHSSVNAGTSEEDNEQIFSEGAIPDLGENAIPHWELAKKYDIIDFELGNKIAGAGFPVYKGKGARLQRALINYFLDKNIEAGYAEVQVPHLVNAASATATGQLPDKDGQMYHATEDDLYLIPTAEVPITNMFRGNLMQETEFPICVTGYTPCFRREAGSYGAHVRGLNRLHQFDKVEIVRIEHPENSYKALDGMVEHIKNILRELKLPYRILRLCGGDTGFTAALTFDFELFSTAQDRWLEISSASNFETFQANRLKLRFKNKEGKSELAHTLNGSSLALPRVLAGILENYQTENGIKIPEVLVPYCGFSMILKENQQPRQINSILIQGSSDSGKSTTVERLCKELKPTEVWKLETEKINYNSKIKEAKVSDIYNNTFIIKVKGKTILISAGAPTEQNISISRLIRICVEINIKIDFAIVSMRSFEKRQGFDTPIELKTFGKITHHEKIYKIPGDDFEKTGKWNFRIERLKKEVINELI